MESVGGWVGGLERAHMLTGGFKRPVPNAIFFAARLRHKGVEKTLCPSARLLSFHKNLKIVSKKHIRSNVF